VINYSSVILRTVANKADVESINSIDIFSVYASFVVWTKTIGVLMSIFLVDRVGRRPLLLFGSVGGGCGLLVACFGYAASSVGWTLVGICAFIFAFSASFASVFWVIVGEFFSMRAKHHAVAAVTATFFAIGALADFIFPPMRSTMSFGVFIFFACVCFASAAFVYAFIPETCGKPLHEVHSLLKDRHLTTTGASGYRALGRDGVKDTSSPPRR
jgi:MFS family permease